MELNENIIRQGDVLLVYVDSPESAPAQIEAGQRMILAHGEVTGHTHALVLDAAVVKAPTKPVYDAAAERYIQLYTSGKLSHEEHEAAFLKAGKYEIGVQVEAGPDNMIRRVAD